MAKYEHNNYINILKNNDINVYNIKDVLLDEVLDRNNNIIAGKCLNTLRR